MHPAERVHDAVLLREVQGMEEEVHGETARMKECDPFYKSTRWKKLRQRILRRDGYLCQLSKRTGRFIQADVVHHIFPRESFPEFQWESWNLISLCGEQHNRLHDRDTRQLTEEGINLAAMTVRKNGIQDADKLLERLNDKRRNKENIGTGRRRKDGRRYI